MSDQQAHQEELLALLKSILKMTGENQKLLREIKVMLGDDMTGEDAPPFKLGEPVDPLDMLDD